MSEQQSTRIISPELEDTICLKVAVDMGVKKWVLGLSDGKNATYRNIAARDLDAFHAEIKRTREHFGLPEDIPAVMVYEAGRDGFWLSRHLKDLGEYAYVVDAASIMRPRKRKNKTDKLDAKLMLKALSRWMLGDGDAWSVVEVPTPLVEDMRRLSRELNQLKKEVNQQASRIESALIRHGITQWIGPCLLDKLDDMVGLDGRALGPCERNEIERIYERMSLAIEQAHEVRRAMIDVSRRAAQELGWDIPKRKLYFAYHRSRLPENDQQEQRRKQREANRMDRINDSFDQMRAQDHEQFLTLFKMVIEGAMARGIGLSSSYESVFEYHWRPLRNRNQMSAATGLAPVSDVTGIQDADRSDGISKQARNRWRALQIQLAWAHVRFQPNSAITKLFKRRYANGNKRYRRIGIVMVARKLSVSMYQYHHKGTPPTGMVFNKLPVDKPAQ